MQYCGREQHQDGLAFKIRLGIVQSSLNYEYCFSYGTRAEYWMFRAGCTRTPDKLVGVETRGVLGNQVLDLCPTSKWLRGP